MIILIRPILYYSLNIITLCHAVGVIQLGWENGGDLPKFEQNQMWKGCRLLKYANIEGGSDCKF